MGKYLIFILVVFFSFSCKTSNFAEPANNLKLHTSFVYQPDDLPDTTSFQQLCIKNIAGIIVPYQCEDSQALGLVSMVKLVSKGTGKVEEAITIVGEGSFRNVDAVTALPPRIALPDKIRILADTDVNFIRNLKDLIENNELDFIQKYLQEKRNKLPKVDLQKLNNLEDMLFALGYDPDFKFKQGSRVAKQLVRFNRDTTLVDYSLAAVEQRRVSIPPDSPNISALEDLKKYLLAFKAQITSLEGGYGQVMVGAALTKNVRLARLERIFPKLGVETQRKLRLHLDRGLFQIYPVSKQFSDGFTTEEIEQINSLLNEEPMAIVARGSSSSTFAHIASGEPGKTKNLKMKSEGTSPYVPVLVEDSIKVLPAERDEFQGYSNSALSTLEDDMLPTSIAIPARLDFYGPTTSTSMSFFKSKFKVKIQDYSGYETTGWLTEDEINARGANVRKIYYHANPRMVADADPSLVIEWKKMTDKQRLVYMNWNDFLPYVPYRNLEEKTALFNAQAHAEGFARFVLSRTKFKGQTLDQITDKKVLAEMKFVPKYISDVDLASLASKSTTGKGDDHLILDKLGNYAASHKEILQYKDIGFVVLGMKPQILHPAEVKNWFFPQTLRKEESMYIVYSYGNQSRYEVVRKPPNEATIHKALFERVQAIHSETGLNILFNARDIVDYPQDYQPIQSILIPAQLDELRTFIAYAKSHSAEFPDDFAKKLNYAESVFLKKNPVSKL